MRLGSRKENRKGITPVVSVILLLLVTISIVGFAMLFFQRTAQSAGEAGQQQLQQQIATTAESFEIVNVDKNKVYVKNTGTANLQNLRFYVDGSEVSATVAPIAPNTVGEAALDSAKLAMQLGDKLRVTSVGFAQEQKADFYGKNTVAYWRFDEADRTTVKDYSGNGNDGTFAGENWNDGTLSPACPNCPQLAAGKYGNAMSFDEADYIEIADSPSNSFTGPFSIELWVNINNFGDNAGYPGNPIIAKGNRAANQPGAAYNMRTTPTGQVVFDVVDNSAGARIGGLTTKTLTINTWYHIVGTWDGGTTTSSTRVFINGEEWFGKDSNPNPLTFASLQDSNQAVQIGRNTDGASAGFFNGIMDEVRIYNRALTQQEIQEDMNSAYPVARTVASYSFEKIVSNQAQDTHNIVKGRYGAAMSFDGVDDYVSVPNLGLTTSFTIEGWVKAKLGEFGGISKDYGTFTGYAGDRRILIENAGRLLVQSGGNFFSATALKKDVWTHIDYVWNALSVKEHYNIDGKFDSENTPSQTPSWNAAFYIGQYDLSNYIFNGIIDEVRILNVAIS